jgi:hypothetical protein
VGFSENGSEPSESIKIRKCPDYLSNYYLIKKNSSPWSQIVSCSIKDEITVSLCLSSSHRPCNSFTYLLGP